MKTVPRSQVQAVLAQGDAALELGGVPDASVHLVNTSPPYQDLIDYDRGLALHAHGPSPRSSSQPWNPKL